MRVQIGSTRLSVQATHLANGVTVVSARDPQAIDVSAGFGIRCGSAYEPSEQNGIHHLIEHLVFKKNARVDAEALAEAIEFTGGEINGATGRENVLYTITELASWRDVPRFLPRLFEMAFWPEFDPEDIEKEKNIILAERACLGEDTLAHAASDALYELLFPAHPLGKPIEGTEESIRALGTEDVHAAHHRSYTAPNLVVAGAGKLRHENLIALAERLTRAIGGPAAPATMPSPPRVKTRIEKRMVRTSTAGCCLCMGFDVSEIQQRPDDRAAFALCRSMLGNGSASRLFRALREHEGIGYDISATVSIARVHAVAEIFFNARAAGELDTAQRIITREIERLQTEQAPIEEIRGHARRLRTACRRDVDDSECILEDLLEDALNGRVAHFYSNYRRILGVSPADIRRAARTYLNLDRSAVVRIEGKSDHAAS